MKRIGFLYEKIIDKENLYKAEKKARKGKSNRKDILKFIENLDDNIDLLYKQLLNQTYSTGQYYHFIIFEPKPRNISKLPYKDRIVHWAIILILEPIFVKSFISQTYSCLKNRGILACLKNLKKGLKDNKYNKFCLKLDIRKFYESVNNQILKNLLRRKFKDNKLLKLLDNIIDSIEALPLGSLTSQFFANFYINGLNHWLKEVKCVKYLQVYCDDFCILSNNKLYLHQLRKEIQQYLKENLNLQLSRYRIFPTYLGIDFVGYVSYYNHTKLRKSIKLRWQKMLRDNFNNKSIASYNGWLIHANCTNLQNKYLNK